MLAGVTAEVRTRRLPHTKSRTLQLRQPAQWLPIFWISQAVHIGRKLRIGADAWRSVCDVLENSTAAVGELGGSASSVQVPHYTEKHRTALQDLSQVLREQRCVEASWNVMAHTQKPDFVFRAKRTSPFKSAGGRQFSRLLAAEVCASAVVMLDTPCSEVVWRVLATHCIRQFPPSLSLPCVTVCHHISTWLYYCIILYHFNNS